MICNFDRYQNKVKMADGISVSQVRTIQEAFPLAVGLANRGDILVLINTEVEIDTTERGEERLNKRIKKAEKQAKRSFKSNPKGYRAGLDQGFVGGLEWSLKNIFK